MPLRIRHPFTSSRTDGADPAQVQPTHWNADHTLQMTGPAIVGREAGTQGDAGEISIGSGLALAGGILFATGGGGGGATNLTQSTTSTSVTVQSDTGIDATIGGATGSAAGVMVAADKTKLDGIAENATANATDAALRDRATHTGMQAIASVTGLQTALDGKQAAGTYATGTGSANGVNTGDQTTITGNAGTATALSAGADRTKLDGIAAGATANAADSALRDRATHTGTQASTTITMATARLLGRTTASAGAAQEISVGSGLSLSAGALSATPSTPNQLGYLSGLNVGFAGDSIAGMWAARTGASPLFQAAYELYPCEINTVLNSSLGGTSSTHLMGTQLAVLAAAPIKPDVLIVQSIQNDFVGSAATAATLAGNVTSYALEALALGVKLVCICAHPPKNGTDHPAALVQLNRILEDFCRDTPGMYFIDVFSVWRAVPTAAETSGIPWRGTPYTSNSYSHDGTHPNALAARAAAPLILPVLKRWARPITPTPQAAVAYDNTNYLYGNVLGLNGLMIGTNGTYNTVTNAGVAGASTGAQDRWNLVDGNGVTATPSLVVGTDGYTYQQLTLSGIASANTSVTLTNNFLFDVAVGSFFAEVSMDTTSLVGVSGITFETSSLFAGTNDAGNSDQALIPYGTTKFLMRSAVASFSNSGFANRASTISINIPIGSTVSGSIRIGRVGIYRT